MLHIAIFVRKPEADACQHQDCRNGRPAEPDSPREIGRLKSWNHCDRSWLARLQHGKVSPFGDHHYILLVLAIGNEVFLQSLPELTHLDPDNVVFRWIVIVLTAEDTSTAELFP